MSQKTTEPDAESHWGHQDPLGQPPRDAAIGVGRMVMEARTRLGDHTDAAAVLADLKARGLNVTAEQVAQFWGRGA